MLKPPKPFYNTSIVFKVCQVKQPKQRSKRRRCLPPVPEPPEPETECWPGVCYFGSIHPAMFWMNGDTDPYDGRPLYSIDDLCADLKAGELMVKAIKTQERLTSEDKYLDRALGHVFAAVHQGSESKEDWLAWLCDILVDIPVQPLNSRGKLKQKHRGPGKATRAAFVAKKKHRGPGKATRAAFVAKLPSGLTRKDEQLLWLDYKK
jgi:hypothetical protein